MPALGFLNQPQKERLQKLVRVGDCPRLREHALILLLQNDGKTYGRVIELDITNSSERTQNYIDYIMRNIYTFGY